MISEAVFSKATDIKEDMIRDRRWLHQNPGLGFEIEKTYKYIKDRLEEMGYSPKKCGKNGLIATVGNTNEKVFLLRADMDGLKIEEETDLDFKSTNGNMHACGHDMHTAMLLGAAKILKEYENEIKGTVKLMFQPAEEILEGSKDMIENGVLENPKVDAGLMIHVMTAVPFKTGQVIVANPGVSAPSADYFTITIQGKAAHGANPSQGIDPINIAAHIVIALQEINAREIGTSAKAIITMGQIQGGNSNNAIPDKVILKGSVRTFDEDVRVFVKKRLVEIVESTGKTFRGDCYVEFTSGCPTLNNNESLVKHVSKYIIELGEINEVKIEGQIDSAGSEDFSYVSHQINTVMIAVAAGEKEKGYEYGLHHPKAMFDEDALPVGSAIYAYVAMGWLEDNNEYV